MTAGVAIASTAHADVDAGATIPGQQSGTVTVTTPTRSGTLRQMPTKQYWISHQDCVDDVQITFTVTVTSPSAGAPLRMFVSNTADCLQYLVRADATQCKEITLSNAVAVSGSPQINLKAKTLTALMGIPNCGDDPGTDTSLRNLKFYFILNPPAQDVVVGTGNNFAIYSDSGIDLWGPDAPTTVVVTPGDEELQVSFAGSPGGAPVGYYFYLDDGLADGGVPTTATTSGGNSTTSTSAGTSTGTTGVGGAGGASTSAGVGGGGGAGGMTTSSSSTSSSSTSSSSTGAGGSGAGGAGGASTTATGAMWSTGVVGSGDIDPCNPSAAVAVCTPGSYVLIPGEAPTYSATGDALTTGTEGNVTKLTNGKAYVVAVAAYDDVGNVGKLSELQCGTPAPVDSILRVYECKGGLTESGCGFCSMGGDRGGGFAALVSGGLVVLGLAARRSRRPRVAGGSRGAR